MTAKLDLVMRRTGHHLIIAGVMVTSNYKAGAIAGMEMYATKTSEDSFQVYIKKEQFTPKDEYGSTFEKHSLSELPSCGVWRGFKSENPSEFGGIIIARDNQLFSNEDPEGVSRLSTISVIQDEGNILDIDMHAAFRSVGCFESGDWLAFTMLRDSSEGTSELLDSLQGDGLLGLYRKPFWAHSDGSNYRLQTDVTLEQFELYGKQTRDLVELGKVSEETRKEMYDQWLSVNEGADYIDFLQNLYKECPFAGQQFERLLTESEHKAIEDASRAIIKSQMGQ